MANKVYIRVTEDITGGNNIISTLVNEGAFCPRQFAVLKNRIYYIDGNDMISEASLNAESDLIKRGYHEIEPSGTAYIIQLHKGDTPQHISFSTPDGFVAVIDGVPVSEIKVELQRDRWKPENNKTYYHVEMSKNAMYVSSSVWTDSIADRQALYLENVFKTKEEASQFLEILKKHYWQASEEYENSLP